MSAQATERSDDTWARPNVIERHGRLWRTDALRFGADYNPEQWPEDVWKEDARLMRDAGVNLVSVGIFSWAVLEPAPGEYDLALLDRVLGLLHDHGIDVDLATATASPPPWLTTRHPEVLPVDGNGRTLWHGGRQAYCPSSPVFRDYVAQLVEQLARRYADHLVGRLVEHASERRCPLC